MTDRRC